MRDLRAAGVFQRLELPPADVIDVNTVHHSLLLVTTLRLARQQHITIAMAFTRPLQLGNQFLLPLRPAAEQFGVDNQRQHAVHHARVLPSVQELEQWFVPGSYGWRGVKR